MNRRSSRFAATLGLSVVCLTSTALAVASGPPARGTILVASDQSIHTAVQSALDATVPGDTLFFGEGEFEDELQLEAYHAVLGKIERLPLTILGAGRDRTFVGRREFQEEYAGRLPVVFFVWTDADSSGSALTVRDMTIGGLRSGFQISAGRPVGPVEMSNLEFVCSRTAGVYATEGFTDLNMVNCSFGMESCTGFSGFAAAAIVPIGYTVANSRISACTFGALSTTPINAGYIDGLTIEDCTIGASHWTVAHKVTDLTIRNCRAAPGLPGVLYLQGRTIEANDSRVVLEDCDFGTPLETTTVQLSFLSMTAELTRVRLEGSFERTIDTSNANLRLRQCTIGWSDVSVFTVLPVGDGHFLDLRHNYWGTTDVVAIRESIIDGDDPPVYSDWPEDRVVVELLPILEHPVSTAGPTSVGELKARFRNRQ